MIVLLSMMFAGACAVWSRANINYAFVFEFNLRHHLDFKQLLELPCIFFGLFGVILYVNFNAGIRTDMFIYWPVVLVGLTLIILLAPVPYLRHRARLWFLQSNWRLLHPFLPVEFRDFFFGDLFCSLTYVLGNVEVFFCLYANNWQDPAQCNSRHSRLLGFFTTLPGMIRAIQCLRRCYDSWSTFPQLYNFFKYVATILFYMSLSLWRINNSSTNHALFLTFATINAVYCSK